MITRVGFGEGDLYSLSLPFKKIVCDRSSGLMKYIKTSMVIKNMDLSFAQVDLPILM